MKKSLFTFLGITLCLFLFASCGPKKNNSNEKKEEDVELPYVIPYKDFDMKTVVKEEAGATYDYSGTYTTSRGLEKDIVFDGSVFNISENDTVAEITVTKTKSGKTSEQKISLTVLGTPDVIDEGITNTWNEAEITQSINYNPAYIKDGNSSVKVTFNGYYNNWGTQYSCIPGHLSNKGDDHSYDYDYYDIYKEEDTAKAFEDAIFYYWVYNDTKATQGAVSTDILLGYRIRTVDGACNIDWNLDNTTVCEAGKWTMVIIRLKDHGIVKDLYKNLDDYYSGTDRYHDSFDDFNLKVVGKNYTLNESGNIDMGKKQSYTFYVDGYNMVSYRQFKEKFPNVDIDSKDYGDTWYSPVFPTCENWYNSNKGFSFEFTFEEGATGSDLFSFIEVVPGAWHRCTEIIEINFDTMTTDYGRLINLGSGKYRYEVMFSDTTLGNDANYQANGNETLNLLYFKTYKVPLTVSNIKLINGYSPS